jgi:hypothetical protein
VQVQRLRQEKSATQTAAEKFRASALPLISEQQVVSIGAGAGLFG